MVLFKRILPFCIILFVAFLGFRLGMRIAGHEYRTVDTVRMERCLELYRQYRYDLDQLALGKELEQLGLTPRDFQEIIDRFIYYRTRKSSLDQAMKLLNAFRLGYDIQAENVYSVSGMESEPFRLDAEILAVFETNPDLIKQAFEG